MRTTLVLMLSMLLLPVRADQPTTKPIVLVNTALTKLASIVEPAPGTQPQTFTATCRLTRSGGLPKEAANASVQIAFQAPDRAGIVLKLAGNQNPQTLAAARDRQVLWAHLPEKKWGIVGKQGVPRFSADPESIDKSTLPPIRLPITPAQIQWPLMLMTLTAQPDETIEDVRCNVVTAAVPDQAAALLKLPTGKVELAIRTTDQFPARLRYSDGKLDIELMIDKPQFEAAWPDEHWAIHAKDGDKIETTAVSHLSKFMEVAARSLNSKIPTLGPVKGDKRLVGTSSDGQGRLEMHDGTRVLFLKGTPAAMGRQQGELLGKELRDVTERILYGVGVGSSFVKGRWFFGEIESAHARLAPFISKRAYDEIDAMADAAGVHRQEGRLSNFFPELFHCSGFALTGEATATGRIYHGRVLDYLKGVGLEQNAVVMVYQPDVGHAWVNCGYAGFIGSVTAMNARGISIGEMGGRGEGKWDGKPMAQLIREVMENAATLEDAVAIMKKGPRTCEYYYVIADGNSKQAVGIAATPETFEVVRLGEAHPRLPHAIKDAVLLSAGDRYERLVERVKAGYGKFDFRSARALMERPVAMNSCIQAVLFAPDTLDFWVANADSQNVASHTRYTHYNLKELLSSSPAK